jgi:TonB family protein
MQRCFSLVLFSLALCASGFSEDRANQLYSLVNQALIFRTYDCSERITVKWGEIRQRAGGDGSVFAIHKIDKKKDKIEFTLENIGSMIISGKKPSGFCRTMFDPVKLTISNIPPSISEVDLISGVRSLLMNADAYLEFNGYVSGKANVGDGTDPAINPDASMPSVSPPRQLLFVIPKYSDEMKRRRVGGVVRVAVVIGRDGRVYSPRITESPAREFDAEVLRVLPLCRYEPVFRDGKPIAAQTAIFWNFTFR